MLKNNLPIFNDYFVENFHSSIRSQTAKSNTALQIIQKAKIIDAERNNDSFKDSFVNLRNPAKSQIKELKSQLSTKIQCYGMFYHEISNFLAVEKLNTRSLQDSHLNGELLSSLAKNCPNLQELQAFDCCKPDQKFI